MRRICSLGSCNKDFIKANICIGLEDTHYILYTAKDTIDFILQIY